MAAAAPTGGKGPEGRRRVALRAALVLLCAAGGLGAGCKAVPAGVAESVSQTPAAASDREFERQPHMEALQARSSPFGYTPETTPWRPAPAPAPALPPASSPGELAFALARRLAADALGTEAMEAAVRVEPGGQAGHFTGIILIWGLFDDSLAGADYRFQMTADEAGLWSLGAMEERRHCRRGLSPDGLCL